MLLSIGDLTDKLIIENIKIWNIREELNNSDELTEEETVKLNEKMLVLNSNRNVLCETLDEKVEKVTEGTEQNCPLKTIRTI